MRIVTWYDRDGQISEFRMQVRDLDLQGPWGRRIVEHMQALGYIAECIAEGKAPVSTRVRQPPPEPR